MTRKKAVELNIKVGDLVKVDQSYVVGVLEEILVPDPSLLQTIQTLRLLADETATVIGIGNISIEGEFCTAVHILPTIISNNLFRGGRGSKIYFRSEIVINSVFAKC